MSEEKKSKRVKVVLGSTKGKLVRFSYLNAHEARLNSESNKMEYSVNALIPKGNTEDVAAVKAAIDSLKKSTWLDEKKNVPPSFWNPLRDGDNDLKPSGANYGPEAKGCYVLNCKTDDKHAPKVVGTSKDGAGKFQPIPKSAVKSGDWGRIGITLGAYVKGTGGVGAYLDTLQFVQEGESLGNSSSAEDDFSAFDDDTSDPLLD